MAPSRRGYANGDSSLQRYPYRPGTLYEIYSSPNHPTTILLPPGERLAAAPTLNPDAWDVGVAEMGSDSTRQEAVIVRPVAPGLEATTPLLTQSGRVFFCRLRSFQTTSMVAVTWDVPQGIGLPVEARTSSTLTAPPLQSMSHACIPRTWSNPSKAILPGSPWPCMTMGARR
jgi:type IV secretion system protein VirB9